MNDGGGCLPITDRMTTPEKHVFQAEIQQLLDIVIHSLYTDREIFIRELISNAADACEKLRFTQASGVPVHQPEVPPSISVTTNEEEKTITFEDTGIGMTQEELVTNLGTIAHSGTKAFVKQLAEDKKADAKLIGQFGVGFYSAFMAGSRVTVLSRSFQPDASGWRWSSEGAVGYEMEPVNDLPRGTKVVIHLKDEEFAKQAGVERVIKRYSNFVQFPIILNGTRLNTVQAIWARSKSEITEKEYQEFYHYIAHAQEDPLMRLHFTADAPLSIQAVLFVPAHNLEMPGMPRGECDVHLHCRKVLIQARPKGLFPEWLRFLRGVVDSEDLPLNISRETMQDTALMQKLQRVLTSRFIKFLEEEAEKEPERFEKFYAAFHRYLKEAVVSDYTHKEAVGRLLRFDSSGLDAGKSTSLAAYVTRMAQDQKEIYYQVAASREAALSSPYLEVFQARRIEVLLASDPWDEIVMEGLHTFDGKNLVSAEKADVTLADKPPGSLSEADAAELVKWLKEQLGEGITEVRVSQRLVESPAVITESEKFMTSAMRRMLKSMKRADGVEAPIRYDLEINPGHGVMARLDQMRRTDPVLAGQVAHQILDNSKVAAGVLEDARPMLKRITELLERVLGKA